MARTSGAGVTFAGSPSLVVRTGRSITAACSTGENRSRHARQSGADLEEFNVVYEPRGAGINGHRE